MIELKAPSGRLFVTLFGVEELDACDQTWIERFLRFGALQERLRQAREKGPRRSETDTLTAAGEEKAARTGKHTGAAN